MADRKRTLRSRQLGNTGQMSLGLEVLASVDTCVPEDKLLKFIDPNPNCILVGDRTLAEWVIDDGSALDELRQLIRSLDYAPYYERYLADGRPAYHPAAMLSLILFGFMTGRTSLRQMQDMARFDIRVWWLSGGILPDYSSLCRFISRHNDVLSVKAFEELSKQIFRSLGSKAKTIAVDGTIIQAAGSRWRTFKEEAARQISEEKAIEALENPSDDKLQQQARHAQVVLETVQKRNAARQSRGKLKGEARVSPSEPEAVIQPMKEGGIAPSYKASVAVNRDRLITAFAVDPSNEASVVAGMLEQTNSVTGVPVKTLLADAGYANGTVIEATASRGVELIAPEGRSSKTKLSWEAKRRQISKTEFAYDEETDTYVCPEGRLLTLIGTFPERGKTPAYRQYRCQNCESCPRSEQCLAARKGKRSARRTVKRYERDGAKAAIRLKLLTEEQRQRYAQRTYTVEPVHGEIKHIQAGRRFRRRGLENVQLEYSLHAMSHNLRRYTTLRARARAEAQAASGVQSAG